MLIRLLQTFSSITLAPEAQHPDTLPPTEWAQAEGRKARERFWPKAHLTIYSHVLSSLFLCFCVLIILFGREVYGSA
jgi:hypothetical protein